MAQIALTASAPLVPVSCNCGAKPWSKSVLLCSSRRYASTSSSSLSITSSGGRSLRIVELKANAAAAGAAASSEGFEKVAEGQLVSYPWADNKKGFCFWAGKEKDTENPYLCIRTQESVRPKAFKRQRKWMILLCGAF